VFFCSGFKQTAPYQGRWRGLRTDGPDAPVVLSDLRNDMAEKTDIAAQHGDVAEKIRRYLQSARSPLPAWEPQWRKPARR
jgi:hypothetical protein